MEVITSNEELKKYLEKNKPIQDNSKEDEEHKQ